MKRAAVLVLKSLPLCVTPATDWQPVQGVPTALPVAAGIGFSPPNQEMGKWKKDSESHAVRIHVHFVLFKSLDSIGSLFLFPETEPSSLLVYGLVLCLQKWPIR